MRKTNHQLRIRTRCPAIGTFAHGGEGDDVTRDNGKEPDKTDIQGANKSKGEAGPADVPAKTKYTTNRSAEPTPGGAPSDRCRARFAARHQGTVTITGGEWWRWEKGPANQRQSTYKTVLILFTAKEWVLLA